MEAKFDARIHPNPTPTNGILNLVLENEEDQVFEIMIFDSVGKMIGQQNVDVKRGSQLHSFNAPQNSGLYFIQIVNENMERKR